MSGIGSSQDSTPRATPTVFSITTTTSSAMSAKTHAQRSSVQGSMSIAERAKRFQSEPLPPIPSTCRTTKKDTAVECSPKTLPSFDSACSLSSFSSAHDELPTATIQTARRISVATPIHRRASSEVSLTDPHFGTAALTSSSIKKLDELTAKLEANRPRSKTYTVTRPRNRKLAMAQVSLCSSTETIKAKVGDGHDSFEVSPVLSEDGSLDWHHFVTSNYGVPREVVDLRQPMRESTLLKHIRVGKKGGPESPRLNEEATWLEEELARCSSDDEEGDTYDTYAVNGRSMDEDEYVTPEGSPLLSPVNLVAAPQVEIMGLGIQGGPSLLLPGEYVSADKSADSLLEQVALHEACIQTLRSIGLPPLPRPAARKAASKASVSTTSISCNTSSLFLQDHTDDEASYDSSVSPMADLGHDDCSFERRTSAASVVSTDSSSGSHASSLLYNVHLAAPRLERLGSADTTVSVASSVASSVQHDKPMRPPRSPMRMCFMPLPPLPSTPVAKEQLDSDSAEGKIETPVTALPKENECREKLIRKASRRKLNLSLEQPELPVRMGSLESAVAAATPSTQIKEEFPDRLLGDWMAATEALVEPVTLDISEKEMPGMGNVTPPSPEHRTNVPLNQVPVYPDGLKSPPSTKLKAKLNLSRTNDDAFPKPNMLDRLRKASSTKAESDRSLLSQSAASAAADFPLAWKDRIAITTRPSIDSRRPSAASLTSILSSSSTPAPRTSNGIRKIFSSISLTPERTPIQVSALASSAFESPKTPRRPRPAPIKLHDSFIDLTTNDADESRFKLGLSPPWTPSAKGGKGRKDLTKMFGASEVDLSQPMTPTSVKSAKEKGWAGSLGRKSSTSSKQKKIPIW